MRKHATHARDSSLRRLSVINRWLVAGSVILTGVLTDVAAHAFPSKSTKQTPSRSAGAHAHSHQHRSRSSSSPATTATSLTPPAEAPRSAPQEPAGEEPAPEAVPAEESVPVEETAPREEASPEPAPSAEAPPSEEASAPVVSGGS